MSKILSQIYLVSGAIGALSACDADGKETRDAVSARFKILGLGTINWSAADEPEVADRKETTSNHRIAVMKLGSGYASVFLVDVTDKSGTYTDIQTTGTGRYKSRQDAAFEAYSWAKSEGLPCEEPQPSMRTITDTEFQLVPFIRDQLGHRGEIKPTDNLAYDYGADSLDAVALTAHFEQTLGVLIPDDKQIEMIGSIENIIRYVEGLRHG